MKRTEDISLDEFIPQWSKRKFATLIVSVAVIATGLLIFQLSRTLTSSRHPTMPENSIAVLPFENLSRDPDNVYFTEGIQDEILPRLEKIADLKVISRTSTQRYKSSPEDLPQIAKRLGVANILEGSVQKTADRVRVTVQLLNAARDEAMAILKQLHDLRESSKQRYVSPFNLALVHIGLGQKDQAIQLLEQTYEERDGYNLAFLKIEPYLDPLRGDPRFEALVEKVFSPTQ